MAGSFNNLFDGWQRLPGEAGAALYAAAPLTSGGEGHLLVMARLKHGVAGDSAVVVNGGVLTVVAADDGVRGEDLIVNGGELLVFAANDALKSTGEAEGTGLVALIGGSVDLVAQGDGVQAERRLEVHGGAVRVVAGGGHTLPPGEASTKGLKAGVELLVAGGAVVVDASDDAVHSDADLLISGGQLTLATGDDAVHADGALLVAGGSLVHGRDASVHAASTQGVVYLDLARMSFTSPAVVVGEYYDVWLGGTAVGVELAGGVFQPAGAVGGESLGSFRAR